MHAHNKKTQYAMGRWWSVHENGSSDKYRHYYWIEKQKCTLIQILQSRQFKLKVCVYTSVKAMKYEQ